MKTIIRVAALLSVHGCYFNPEIKSAPYTATMMLCVWIAFESFKLLKKQWKYENNASN